jgi:hypothetical protein
VAFNQTFDICRQGEESVWVLVKALLKYLLGFLFADIT